MLPYLLTVDSSLGLYKPWRTLLSPSIILLPGSEGWATHPHFTPRGCAASGAASPHEALLEAEPTAGAPQPHIPPRPPLGASQRLLSSIHHYPMVFLCSVLKMNHVKCRSQPLWTLTVKIQVLKVRPTSKNRCLSKKSVREKHTIVLNNECYLWLHRPRNILMC